MATHTVLRVRAGAPARVARHGPLASAARAAPPAAVHQPRALAASLASPARATLLAVHRGPRPSHAAPKDKDAEGEEAAEMIEMEAEEKMEKSIDSVRRNFNTVRTGRANVSILDRIQVDYYGAMTPLKSMANASTPDAQTISIQPFDKTAIKDIERALQLSDLGLTPSNDGNLIRLTIPQLTQDRRKELSKLVGKLTEDGKIALRNVRRDALKDLDKLEKDKALSEDSVTARKEAIQKLTDRFVKQVDDLAESKNKELMQV